MTIRTIRDHGVPAALAIADALEEFGCDSPTPKDTAKCSAVPVAVPVSPCPSDGSSVASAASVAPYSVTGMFRDLEERYRVDERVLGSGHQGTVRGCVDRATGMRRAVKSIRKSDPAVKQEALLREIALLQRMDHQGIIRLVDVFEDDGHLHLVTELCEGGELFDRIVERSAADNGAACFPEDEAADIIRQVLASVSYMHGLGVVHRDIKPENILFETADEGSPVKIADFGLSKRHVEGINPPMDAVVGTPYYIAPEVLRKRYDKSCDLWSVGVIAYIMLCGYPPFNGGSNRETQKAVLEGWYDFPREDWEGVSLEARDFVRGLLRTDPLRRMTAEQALRHPWVAERSNRRPDRSVRVGQQVFSDTAAGREQQTCPDRAMGVAKQAYTPLFTSRRFKLHMIAEQRARKVMCGSKSRVRSCVICLRDLSTALRVKI